MSPSSFLSFLQNQDGYRQHSLRSMTSLDLVLSRHNNKDDVYIKEILYNRCNITVNCCDTLAGILTQIPKVILMNSFSSCEKGNRLEDLLNKILARLNDGKKYRLNTLIAEPVMGGKEEFQARFRNHGIHFEAH